MFRNGRMDDEKVHVRSRWPSKRNFTRKIKILQELDSHIFSNEKQNMHA